jgi:glutathionyl-hydroquinone reductase
MGQMVDGVWRRDGRGVTTKDGGFVRPATVFRNQIEAGGRFAPEVTEADWRLFTTLIRFDTAYHGHFKCNVRRLVDYPVLWDYTRSLYQMPGVAATVSLAHIRRHYYLSHPWIDPTGILPAGPELNLNAPGTRTAEA